MVICNRKDASHDTNFEHEHEHEHEHDYEHENTTHLPSPLYIMNPYGVSEEKARALEKRLDALGVRQEDLEERFIRASGPGGQHVNKVSTCVRLCHAPSGLEVRSQAERSQALNRYRARVRLAEKLDKLQRGRKTETERLRQKIRRRKRQRSKRAKQKMLQDKRRVSQKKGLRGKPDAQEQ